MIVLKILRDILYGLLLGCVAVVLMLVSGALVIAGLLLVACLVAFSAVASAAIFAVFFGVGYPFGCWTAIKKLADPLPSTEVQEAKLEQSPS